LAHPGDHLVPHADAPQPALVRFPAPTRDDEFGDLAAEARWGWRGGLDSQRRFEKGKLGDAGSALGGQQAQGRGG
jgi:hypothetical protein